MCYAVGSQLCTALDQLPSAQITISVLSLRLCPHTSQPQPISLLQQLNRCAAAADLELPCVYQQEFAVWLPACLAPCCLQLPHVRFLVWQLHLQACRRCRNAVHHPAA
jgi:hypothetical protein